MAKKKEDKEHLHPEPKSTGSSAKEKTIKNALIALLSAASTKLTKWLIDKLFKKLKEMNDNDKNSKRDK